MAWRSGRRTSRTRKIAIDNDSLGPSLIWCPSLLSDFTLSISLLSTPHTTFDITQRLLPICRNQNGSTNRFSGMHENCLIWSVIILYLRISSRSCIVSPSNDITIKDRVLEMYSLKRIVELSRREYCGELLAWHCRFRCMKSPSTT